MPQDIPDFQVVLFGHGHVQAEQVGNFLIRRQVGGKAFRKIVATLLHAQRNTVQIFFFVQIKICQFGGDAQLGHQVGCVLAVEVQAFFGIDGNGGVAGFERRIGGQGGHNHAHALVDGVGAGDGVRVYTVVDAGHANVVQVGDCVLDGAGFAIRLAVGEGVVVDDEEIHLLYGGVGVNQVAMALNQTGGGKALQPLVEIFDHAALRDAHGRYQGEDGGCPAVLRQKRGRFGECRA